jgi:hypothetical protein
MKEKYTDYNENSYSARIITPDNETKKLIAGELERTLHKTVSVKGIIASNVEESFNNMKSLLPLWSFMNNLKLKHFGNHVLNTGSYNSFEQMKSALTPARKDYKEGKGYSRFDMIVYENI